MAKPIVFVDFQNADTQGRPRLNCAGTLDDLTHQRITLQDGLALTLYSEDLEVDGLVKYSSNENLWVACIDWNEIREVVSESTFPEYQAINSVNQPPPRKSGFINGA